jgi:tRNA(Ile)-lysidine synthase TilS/MesJ
MQIKNARAAFFSCACQKKAVILQAEMEKSPEQIEEGRLRAKLTKRFHKACADYGLIADGDHILIGLSGGKDSLLLTELLGRRAKIYKPRFAVTALHVRVKERDYQTDLSYLENFCREAGVKLIVRDTMINDEMSATASLNDGMMKKETNPCFLCSWYRRKALFNAAQEMGCNKIAFGHHRDDVVETLLMNLIYQGAFATMPPVLQMEKMPLQLIRPLCLIDEADIRRYAEMRSYQKQPKLCPFEHVSSREKVKGLLEQIKALNPEAVDSISAAMSNIKFDYLPHVKQLNS